MKKLDLTFKKIPEQKFPNYYAENNFINERLVNIADYNNPNIIIEPSYYNQGLETAIKECYMRSTVAEKINEIALNLPNGYKLKILDAWRPFDVQLELYNSYKIQIEIENPNLSEEEIVELTRQFVSVPNYDNNKPPVHCTGGAVDLTIVDENGKELDMGTKFDDFTEKAHTSYFEKIDESSDESHNEIVKNRRFLYNTMINAGFTNLPTEWWHYDYGNNFWALQTKNKILYNGIFKLQ